MVGAGKQGRELLVNFLAFVGQPVWLFLKAFFWLLGRFFSGAWKLASSFNRLLPRFWFGVRKMVSRNFSLVFSKRFFLFRKIKNRQVPSRLPGKTIFPRPLFKRIKRKILLRWPKVIVLVVLVLLFYFFWSIFNDLPRPEKLITREIKQTTRIYDRNGNLLYKIFRQQNRTLVPLAEVPPIVKEATIAIEDGDFYQHRGISFSGIARAIWRLISERKIEGGSTITQQLVKNALLSSERTITRKVKEVVLALMVEMSFSKDEILQMYLNEVAYGGATYGIEEASHYYFGKSVTDLDLAEAALLAGLPASPTTYSPFGTNPQLAKMRQREVLGQMVKKGFISWEEAQNAEGAEVRLGGLEQNILAPHFVMQVKQELADIFGTRFVEEGGLQVTTTLDLATQQLAEKAVFEELAGLANYHVTNGAALVTVPKTGEVLAMVGSRDYFDQENEGNFNVTSAARQPGSTIKVVNYALALQNGYTLASQISDSPVVYQIGGQPPYQPVNYDNRFHGLVTIRTALACSYNVPAVKVLASLGVERMIALGQRMGIDSWQEQKNQFGLSLTLGGGEVTMQELATVYGVLANQGTKVPLQTILQVHDNDGRLIWSNSCLETVKVNSKTFAVQARADDNSCREEILSPQIAYLLTSVLSDNQARSPVFGGNSIINIPGYQVAVKTGTTNNLRDNWTIGYTPDILVAAWVGNNDNSPMSRVVSGVTGASPIWRRIMEKLIIQGEKKDFPLPEGISKEAVCLSWDDEKQACQKSIEEFFAASSENQEKIGKQLITNLTAEETP